MCALARCGFYRSCFYRSCGTLRAPNRCTTPAPLAMTAWICSFALLAMRPCTGTPRLLSIERHITRSDSRRHANADGGGGVVEQLRAAGDAAVHGHAAATVDPAAPSALRFEAPRQRRWRWRRGYAAARCWRCGGASARRGYCRSSCALRALLILPHSSESEGGRCQVSGGKAKGGRLARPRCSE